MVVTNLKLNLYLYCVCVDETVKVVLVFHWGITGITGPNWFLHWINRFWVHNYLILYQVQDSQTDRSGSAAGIGSTLNSVIWFIGIPMCAW